MVILMDGELYKVLERHHHTPGNLRGFVQAKLRRLSSGTLHEHRFRSVDTVDRAVLDRREMEFLYEDGNGFHFMDSKTFEQVTMSRDDLGDTVYFLLPNVKVEVESYEGRPIGVEPPITVELRVVKTDPRLKGATVSNVNKPATLETGLIVQVPPFIEEGETVRIDTRDSSYIERVK
jgi:elongation factor P